MTLFCPFISFVFLIFFIVCPPTPNTEQSDLMMARICKFPLLVTLFYLHMIQITIAGGNKATSSPTLPPSPMPSVSTAIPSAFPSMMPTATPINMMHYFLPGSTLTFNDSAQFCSDLCNSDLASIHSQSQLNDAVNAI
eukprot:709497_1